MTEQIILTIEPSFFNKNLYTTINQSVSSNLTLEPLNSFSFSISGYSLTLKDNSSGMFGGYFLYINKIPTTNVELIITNNSNNSTNIGFNSTYIKSVILKNFNNLSLTKLSLEDNCICIFENCTFPGFNNLNSLFIRRSHDTDFSNNETFSFICTSENLISTNSTFSRNDYKNIILDANLENVTDTNDMFYNCCNTQLIELNSLPLKSITDMSNMFYNDYNLETIKCEFECNNLEYIEGAFFNCNKLKNIEGILDFSKIETDGIDSETFFRCYNLENLYIKNLNCDLHLYSCLSLNRNSIKFLLNNVKETLTEKTIYLSGGCPGFLDLYENDEDYINAKSKGWNIEPPISNKKQSIREEDTFKVIYTDKKEKYDNISTKRKNALYIIDDEINGKEILFEDSLLSHIPTVKRL